MERLPRRRKYLETFLSSHISPKDGQYLPQKSFGKANSNISTPKFCSTHSQANNSTLRKAEIRITSEKMRYKVYQIRQQGKYLSQYGFLELDAGSQNQSFWHEKCQRACIDS